MILADVTLDPATVVPLGGMGATFALVLRVLWRTNSDARAAEKSLREEFAASQAVERAAFNEERTRLRAEFAEARAQDRADIATLRTEVDVLRAQLRRPA